MENCFLVLFGDANALIIDHEDYLLGCLVIGNKHLYYSLVLVFNCVLDQIDGYLLKPYWVSNDVQRQDIAKLVIITQKLTHDSMFIQDAHA